MKVEETPEHNFNRILAEKGGPPRQKIFDVLDDGDYKRQVKSADVEELKKINATITQRSNVDSVQFFLRDAIFYENKNYLYEAYKNYWRANDYLKKNDQSSKVVNTVLIQFLYRIGRFSEVKEVD